MSRQLSRLRNLISEIDEIQRQGQSKSRATPPPMTAAMTTGMTEMFSPVSDEPTLATPSIPSPSLPPRSAPGRIALSLDANVVLDVCGIVEIKKMPEGLEILFEDGKAFHIPFKDVA